jgi:hypothetical protein
MSSRQTRRSRRKNRKFVPIKMQRGESKKESCWCEDERLLEGYGLPGTPPPNGGLLVPPKDATESSNPANDVTNFIEDCLLVASSSPQAAAGPYIHKSLELVAEMYWPDLVVGAQTWFDGETEEIVVETETAAFRIKVREVPKATAHHGAGFEGGPRHIGAAPWQH